MNDKNIQFRYEDNNEDFIGTYYNLLSKDKCEELIDHFEQSLNDPDCMNNFIFGNNQMPQEDMSRKDVSLNIMGELKDYILSKLYECYEEYKDVYFPAKCLEAFSPHVKMQRTPPRGGYHIWHSELNDISSIHRVLAWIIYLNDIPDGEGETEFLWQKRRVKPEFGKCVIWPAHFTHLHRGNPVYSEYKYIITGWFFYKDVYDGSSDSEWFYDPIDDSSYKKIDKPEKYAKMNKRHKLR